MKKLGTVFVGVLIAVFILTSKAMATPPIFNGGWVDAYIAAAGETQDGDTYWDITVNYDLFFDITDTWAAGDYFQVFDWGNLIFTTPVVPYSDLNVGDDPDTSWIDPAFSSGGVLLTAGDHRITIYDPALDDPTFGFYEGDVFTRYDSAGFATRLTVVPEPTSLLLLSSGLIGLAGIGRKKRKEEI